MFQEILEKNISFIKNQKLYHPIENAIDIAVNILNQDNILSVSGLRHTGKTKLVHMILKKTQSFDTCFYYNSDLDTLGVIQGEKDMITLLDIYIRIHGIPKIIVLQNSNNIDGIKGFISQLIKTKKYKIVIVGNNIKIQGVQEIELFPLGIDSKNMTNNCYGGISEVRIIPDIDYKMFLLGTLKHDIVSRDILEAYTIKNISLFYRVITYISKIDIYQSLREIHRNLEQHGVEIALLTMIDYINAALNTKLIYRCYLYDIKNSNTITSKAQYFFGDIGIRKSFSDTISPIENLLFIELKRNNFEVSGGLNGRFQFSFRASREKQNYSIALEDSEDKSEIRKTARKLAKIGDSSFKYVIIRNKEDLNMRKFEENGVSILTLEEFVEILKK